MMSHLHEFNHPYYCSESNFYSNEPRERYQSVGDFLAEWEDQDCDLNLCFRWDVTSYDEESVSDKTYHVSVFIMLQRKGIFKPIHIEQYDPEHDEPLIRPYLQKHWERLKEIWAPISGGE